MRGCMGDVRHNPREGVVEGLRKHTYPDGHKSWVVDLEMDDGQKEQRPSSCCYWTRGDDGVPEYLE